MWRGNKSDGRFKDILYVDGGVSTTGTIGYVKMQGRDVFRHAVEKLASAMDEVLELANLTSDDIDWLVPHQANIRIINAMQKKLNLPDITITTNSEEAKNAFLDAMYNFETRGSNEQRRTLLNQAITIDPDFLLAKAALYSFVGTEFNNSVLESVYEERNKVSDMEAKIIEI